MNISWMLSLILSTKGSIKMSKCYYCGGDLIWGGDDDSDEEFELVTNLTCSKCEAFVLYHKPLAENCAIKDIRYLTLEEE